jgi:hypothetical protein
MDLLCTTHMPKFSPSAASTGFLFSPPRTLTNSRFLLDEVIKLQSNEFYQSNWLKRHPLAGQQAPSFSFLASSIFLFISGAPCGDASLDLLAEDPHNAIPWTTASESENPDGFRGHEYIWERGKVRFKPGIIILLIN